MAKYVLYGSRDAIPPPFYSTGGHFLGLALPGDQGKIDALIELVLNQPAAGKVVYEPLGHWVVLLIGSFDDLASGAVGYLNHGTVSETQLSIWIAVRAKPKNGPEHICLTAPYIVVDNPMSLVSGRDDFGYPKTIGKFTPERWNGSGMQVRTFGGNYGIGNHADWTELVTVTPLGAAPAVTTSGGPGTATPAPQTPIEVARELARCAGYEPDETSAPGDPPSPIMVVEEVVRMLEGDARQVFLKQFRDVSNWWSACYQAVIEAPAKVLNPVVSLSPYPWTVSLVSLDSQPLVGELGLATGQMTLAFEVSMDIVLEPGAVVA